MKPALVSSQSRDLKKKKYSERIQLYDSLYRRVFLQKIEKIWDVSQELVDRKQNSDIKCKSLDHETAVDSWHCNELVKASCRLPILSTSVRKPILWVKELDSSPMLPELQKFQVINSEFMACDSFKISLEISLDPESDADFKLLQSICTPTKKQQEVTLFPVPDTSSLYLETKDCRILFYREPPWIFNLHGLFVSRNEFSNIIMQSLTEDHWFRFKQIIEFARILYQCTSVEHALSFSPSSPDFMFDERNHLARYTCLLFTSVERECNVISKAIESLDFFSQLSIEDQIILLKDSFIPIDCLVFTHTYDEEIESYVFSALNGMLSFCSHRERLTMYPENQRSKGLNFFLNSFIDKFLDFLRKDYFVISVLSIICILEEKPGITCTAFLENERRLYWEILDAYINANVIAYKWPLEPETICQNIHEILRELARYANMFKQVLKEQKGTEKKQY